jgi:hypothetical protein
VTEVSAIAPEPGLGVLLPGAQFIDAYRLILSGERLEAREAARRMLIAQPLWITGLMSVRHALVRPLGLKTSRDVASGDRIGLFPVQSQTPERIVLGFEDAHLDFRVVVDAREAGAGCQVTASTLVRLNNALGRVYLAAVMPFHRLIVPALLAKVAAG